MLNGGVGPGHITLTQQSNFKDNFRMIYFNISMHMHRHDRDDQGFRVADEQCFHIYMQEHIFAVENTFNKLKSLQSADIKL